MKRILLGRPERKSTQCDMLMFSQLYPYSVISVLPCVRRAGRGVDVGEAAFKCSPYRQIIIVFVVNGCIGCIALVVLRWLYSIVLVVLRMASGCWNPAPHALTH